ncbi:6083_t:CDS:1 [Cetraspora pellucida]|uniref:6083_t:CDS:1 n=1 Tax=Cetraspora pellucida TaxID=1433469 RepID=A0A9N9CI64_9GLOM|nr:6083_t:CDS:1 [Cetraspora pellucida]
MTSYQCFECEVCRKIYKTKRGLNCHKSVVKRYNVRREGLYVLPLEAVNQFKSDLIYIIRTKLKEHFKQSGKQTLSFPCLESLFFGVFEGYIHHFNYTNGSYKCFFQGPDAYSQLAYLLNNQNWGRKFFDDNHQTLVLLFDAQAEERERYKKKPPITKINNRMENKVPKGCKK